MRPSDTLHATSLLSSITCTHFILKVNIFENKIYKQNIFHMGDSPLKSSRSTPTIPNSI